MGLFIKKTKKMNLTKPEIQILVDIVYAEMKKSDEGEKKEKADKLEIIYEKLRAKLYG